MQRLSTKDNRAVVIGAGFGGLAAAVRLGARGWDVTVLEHHDQPGGRARVFRDGGFVFDAGPTVITAPFLFEELWELCGKRMEDHVTLRPVDPFYRVRHDDGSVFDYSGDPERMRAQIRDLSPDDVEGYERFVQMSQEIFNVGFERLAHVPFDSWLDMAKIVPEMVRLESYRTVYGLVARFVKNEKLRQVLSFHPLLVGGNPFTTTSIYSLIPYLERTWDRSQAGVGALLDEPVRLVLRDRSPLRGRGAPYDPGRPALRGVACGHLRAARARRRFQPVLAPPDGDRPVARAAGGRDVLRLVEAHLERTVLPDLSKHVVASRWMTPVHFRDELLSERGAAFGLEPVLTQSAYFRPHNRSEEVAGLYLVGAGTHPGAGVPGVLSSARVLDAVVPRVTDAA